MHKPRFQSFYLVFYLHHHYVLIIRLHLANKKNPKDIIRIKALSDPRKEAKKFLKKFINQLDLDKRR